MSIKTPLTTAFKKTPNSNHQIANLISKTLNSSQSFNQTHTQFPLTSLNPQIITLVLTNPQNPLQSCFNFFNSIQPHNSNLIEPYISLSCRLYKAKHFASAKNILNQLAFNNNIQHPVQKITSFVNTYNGFSKIVVRKLFDTLFRVYADTGRFNESLEVFQYMKSNGFSKIDDRSCMVFLLAAKRYGKFDLLSGFFREMVDLGVGITVYSMTMAVSAMCKVGESVKARELVNEMIVKGVKPNANTYNVLIDTHLKKHEFNEVEVVLDSMKTESVSVSYNVVTYTLLIEFYSVLGKIEDAQKVFDEMLEKGIAADVYAYTSLISCNCKLGKMKRVFELFDELTERGLVPNVHTYGVLLKGVCKAGEMKAAEVLLSEMKSKGLEVNDVIINTLMDGYCKKGNVDDAINLQSLMEKKGFKPSVISYNIIAAGLCKANRLEEAKTTLFTMVDRGVALNTMTYTTLIDVFCKQGEFVEARRMFREMESNGEKPNVVTYNAFIDGYCKKGLMKDAYRIISDMEVKGVKPDVYTYTCLVHGECMAGRVDDAKKLFDEMPERGFVRNVISYTAMIAGLSKEERSEEAFALYDEMQKVGISPDDTLYSSLVGSLHSG
ncbi:uncharacterized protein LOC143553708 [Bidens hawaiensis]|uniref:uncharacterized protein LOC143553708 n=1 Tax=Bidens hawaiensis TaxID=980011 RepID=UPI00404A928A